MMSIDDATAGFELDFNLLKEYLIERVLASLGEIKGEKQIFVSTTLWTPFAFITQGLKLSISKLPNKLETPSATLVFIISADLASVNEVLKFVRSLPGKINFIAYFWSPPASALAQMLINAGFNVKALGLGLVPLENDVLSLELQNTFSELLLKMNADVLRTVKDSILLLENLYGKIPLKFAKGKWASMIFDSLSQENQENEGRIDALILLDREIDMVAPFLMQMTYEGLIDEFFGITFGSIEPDDKPSINLLADPLFYQKCRGVHFNSVKTEFAKIAKKIESLKKRSYDSKSLGETAAFMKQMRDLKKAKLEVSLPLHSSLASKIDKLVTTPEMRQIFAVQTDIITGCDVDKYVVPPLELLLVQANESAKHRILRLLCVLSLTNGGIPKEKHISLTKGFVQAYGAKEILRLMLLEKTGLLRPKKTEAWNAIRGLITGSELKSDWGKIADLYKLVNIEVNLENPQDISYAYGGYAPLSVRIVETLVTPFTTSGLIEKVPGEKRVSKDWSFKQQQNGRQKTVLVYYIGGVTYSEIACFRLLSRLTGTKFIIATTEFTNGNKLLKSLDNE